MLTLGILLFVFDSSTAVDLSGCQPGQPKVIDALQKLSGVVTSPGYEEGQDYPNDLVCQYTIKAPDGFRIKLSFLGIDIEPSELCARDAVELIKSPRSPTDLPLGVFCGNQAYPPVIVEGNTVDIIFRSDFMVARRGFRIQYQASERPSVCDHLGQIPCRNGRCYYPMDRCNGVDNCGDGSDEQMCGFPLKIGECGIRKTVGFNGYDRVIGGKEADPGSWPWQADLQVSFAHPNGHVCGGTLINSQWVLTASHCFMQFRVPQAWRIHLGNHHKFKKDASEQVRLVERIILYPGTTGNDLIQLPQIDVTNDLALMKLNAPVRFTNQVRPACLPFQGYEIPVSTKCMASGWGATRGTGSNNVLKEIDFTIQPVEACNSTSIGIVPETMICVRNVRGYQAACHGDSGGPLVCELNDKWHVMGATSFVTDTTFQSGLCALPGTSTIYSKVAHKVNWINQQISKYT